MIIEKKVSVQGEFAKAGVDITDGSMITLLDEGTITSGEFGDRHTFKVQTQNGEKNLSLNQTSKNNLVDAFGTDSKLWIGKKVKAWVIKTMVSGKLRNVVYLAPSDWTMSDSGTFSAPSMVKSVEEEYIDEYPS